MKKNIYFLFFLFPFISWGQLIDTTLVRKHKVKSITQLILKGDTVLYKAHQKFTPQGKISKDTIIIGNNKTKSFFDEYLEIYLKKWKILTPTIDTIFFKKRWKVLFETNGFKQVNIYNKDKIRVFSKMKFQYQMCNIGGKRQIYIKTKKKYYDNGILKSETKFSKKNQEEISMIKKNIIEYYTK